MVITEAIRYVGVNDHKVDLFEGQYVVPNGMSYNSYVIFDKKIAVLDTVDKNFKGEWFDRLEAELAGRKPDYLVVHHMEPDHSANIFAFAEKYPEAIIVSSLPAFKMMMNFFGVDFIDRRVVVKEGDTLELGSHTLSFIGAPMVHWPEVLMSYETTEKVLFSADGFGKFGALDVEEEWDDEARRYFIGIVGKFGKQVQSVLEKASTLDINMICPLHGPVLNDNLGHYIGLYNSWSSYTAEDEEIVIAYTSVYGNTKEAVLILADEIKSLGGKVTVYDLARDDMAKAVDAAFQHKKVVLATTTYNGEIFPFMHDYIVRLKERNFQKRTVALIENGAWAPSAAKYMLDMLSESKEIEFLPSVTIKGALSDESRDSLKALANGLV